MTRGQTAANFSKNAVRLESLQVSPQQVRLPQLIQKSASSGGPRFDLCAGARPTSVLMKLSHLLCDKVHSGACLVVR